MKKYLISIDLGKKLLKMIIIFQLKSIFLLENNWLKGDLLHSEKVINKLRFIL